jgi:peroxiredoxin/outer membrane lipoprotein-sorting protein
MIALLLALALPAAAQDDARARDILAAAGSKLRPAKTFQATVTHQMKGVETVTTSTLYFKRPMLWHFKREGSQVPMSSVNDGVTCWSYTPRSFSRYMDLKNQLDFHGGAMAILFYYPDGAPLFELASRVEVRRNKMGDVDCDVVLIERSIVKSVTEIWVDPDRKVRRQVFRQTVETKEVERTWEMGEQVLSPELSPDLFKYTPGADLKELGAGRPVDVSLLRTDTPSPDADMTDAAGKKLKLSEFKKKTVVLLFWSEKTTDLGETFEALDRLQNDYKTVVFLAINQGNSAQGLKEIAQRSKLPLRFVPQKADEVSKAFGVIKYPTTYVISPDRTIAARNSGFSELQVREALEKLAAKK